MGTETSGKLGIPAAVQTLILGPLAAGVAVALVPLRIFMGGLQKMREILGILIFLGLGILIAAAVVWYVTAVYQWWNASSGPPAIGAVVVVGLDDARTKAVSTALPSMILAELKRVGGRTNEAKRQLRELESQTGQPVPTDERFAAVKVPEGLKTDVAIPQQVAGVEIGWLLTWIKDFLASTNVIDLTLSFDTDGKRATVFGHAKGKAGYAFHFQDDTGRPDEVARAISAAIIQHEQRRGEIAVQPLPLAQYLPFVDALSAYATYEKVIRSWRAEQQGRPDFKQEYKTQLDSIGKIAESHIHWAELQWLAAEIAERADDRGKARIFTLNEQRLTPRDNSRRYDQLASRLERLTEKTKIVSATSADKLKEFRRAAGLVPDATRVAPIRKFLDLPATLPSERAIRIASIGVPWPEALSSVNAKTLRDLVPHEQFADYVTSAMQVSRIVAPDAAYEFVGTTFSAQDLASALAEIERALPDVFYYSFTRTPTALPILRNLAAKLVVVVAAGNEQGDSEYSSIEDVALVVGATDLKGFRANFSSSVGKGIWAPGVDIPFTAPDTGQPTAGSGTSYSAALVAGAAARLKAAHPTAQPQQIVAALRNSAKAPAAGALPVISVTAALEHLAKSLTPPPLKTPRSPDGPPVERPDQIPTGRPL